MKYFSTFSGIGGFEKAIHDVFPNAECVGFSEIDKYAIQVYQKHFPTHKNFGDISKINIETLPDFDLLVGGSPCQDLSVAKKDRQGLEGSRSGLFFKFVEILKKKKPKYFILENVNSMSKENKDKISDILGVQSVMINASLVSAQNRKRLFWANFPITQPEDKEIFLKDILEENTDEGFIYNRKNGIGKNLEKAVCMSASDWRGLNRNQNQTCVRIGQIGKGGQGDRIYSPEGKSVNLSANGGGRGAKTGLYAVASRTYPRYKEEGVERKKQIEIRKDKKSNALTSVNGDSMVMEDYVVRKLTPTECARLQCFDDNWCEGISNSQQYKCYGNAVNVEVVKHIIQLLWKTQIV